GWRGRSEGQTVMKQILVLLASTATAVASLVSVEAEPSAPPTLISRTTDGKPILLARVVVAATPLSE
ncbi:MAG: hypothetical protein ABW048_02780, partial [Sphingobium sp.]